MFKITAGHIKGGISETNLLMQLRQRPRAGARHVILLSQTGPVGASRQGVGGEGGQRGAGCEGRHQWTRHVVALAGRRGTHRGG